MNAFWSETRSVWERKMGKTVNSHKNSRKKLKKKNLKTIFEMQNTRFSQLIQVASQSPGHPPKHFKPKDLKKFAKCFLRLEISLTRESRAEPWNMYPSQLDLSLANKSPKPTRELATVACDLNDLRLSRQKRAILFLKFFSFCKNKILSKNT